jgi:RNA polymerase sigma-70 factor (ECF subfamily)
LQPARRSGRKPGIDAGTPRSGGAGKATLESDVRVIARARRGEQAAFAELLRAYKAPVFNLCLRMLKNRDDAEDIAQEVFIKVFGMLERYDERYAFRSWLFKIAANQCIDFIRKNRVKLQSLDEPVNYRGEEIERQFPDDESKTPDEELELQEVGRLLLAITDELPPHYRSMIVLRHQEQLSYEEIAQVLDLPLGTVKARIHRARAMMREKLRKRHGGPDELF